jgi:hypothetical protein
LAYARRRAAASDVLASRSLASPRRRTAALFAFAAFVFATTTVPFGPLELPLAAFLGRFPLPLGAICLIFKALGLTLSAGAWATPGRRPALRLTDPALPQQRLDPAREVIAHDARLCPAADHAADAPLHGASALGPSRCAKCGRADQGTDESQGRSHDGLRCERLLRRELSGGELFVQFQNCHLDESGP